MNNIVQRLDRVRILDVRIVGVPLLIAELAVVAVVSEEVVQAILERLPVLIEHLRELIVLAHGI